MLIDRHQLRVDKEFRSPVVGSKADNNDKIPTSGDVHLFADPITFETERPTLYADCEGMEGGEGLTYGAQTLFRKRAGSINKIRKTPPWHLTRGCRSRNVTWADTEDTQSREFMVKELYPRLLYTFSDVVVFVLRNAK